MRPTLHGSRLLAAIAVLLLCARPARAELTVLSEVDTDRLGVEDQVQLTLTITGEPMPDQIPMPALKNLDVVAGPMTSQQVSFVNGRVTRSHSVTFILRPRAAGKAEIGAVRVKAADGEYSAPPVTLEVLPGSVRPKATAAPVDPWDPFAGSDEMERFFGRRRGRAEEPKIFVEAAVDRSRVFVGEPVLLTYWLYTQFQPSDLRFADPPKYAGFWTEDLPRPPQAPGGERVTVEGEQYQRFPLFQKLLFPTKAGTVPVPPTTLEIGVQRGGGFFDMPTNAVVRRSTKALQVVAEAVPDHPGFSGAVGRFTATASLDKPTAALGEAVTLRFAVQGNGNLKWIDRGPELRIDGAKTYPPQITSDLRATPSGLTGTKTWEIVIVPETGGTVEIPRLAFSYFDPEKRQMAEAVVEPLRLDVQGGGPAAAGPGRAPAAARAGGALPLRSDLDPPLGVLPSLSARVLGGAVVLVLLIHGALWATPWLLDRRRESAGATAGRGRDVRRAVAALERVGRDGMSKEASVTLIERTLHDVFGPLDEDSTAPENERERAARQVLQEVYFIRYAPQLGDYSEQIRQVAQRAADVVRRWA